jgi:hypothetical protein
LAGRLAPAKAKRPMTYHHLWHIQPKLKKTVDTRPQDLF